MDELLKQLIEYLQTVSPQLWAILLKQVYSNAAVQIVAGIIFLTATFFCIKICVRAYKAEALSSVSGILCLCCGVTLLIFGVCFLLSGAQGFYNPEYYAITNIIELLRGQ
jgi:hypothetical protein